jgi:hypothetical protein
MASNDLQQFIIERFAQYDPNADTTSGSPVDVQLIQPILRRLGTDPFTIDIGLFIQTRLNQTFPDMPTKEGDAIADLLIKAAILLWNPLVREVSRVQNNLSFKDPTILTTDEAEALGANLFAPRNVGDFARGTGRIYFAQAQNATVTPANFFTSRSGLHFYPTQTQSIAMSEMLLNTEQSLYYFDVSLIAEAAGDAYNLDVNELASVANMGSAVRVTNKARFRYGTADEDTVTYVDRIGQELTERSLVTQRGITARLTGDFPELTQLSVVGFQDPEMQRDVLRGGGLGAILAAGVKVYAIPDGENAVLTRRLQVDLSEAVDFTALIGPTGSLPAGFVVTLHGAFPLASLPLVRDLKILRVVDTRTLDLQDQVLSPVAANVPWVLRASTLTLSGIPGGILFPNNPDGTVTIQNDAVHIGGATDIYVRGAAFDPATLVINSITADSPLLQGLDAETASATQLVLYDLVLAPGAGANYSVGDSTYLALVNALENGLSLQLLDPPNAGSYRVLDLTQTAGLPPVLTVTPTLAVTPGTHYRWKLTNTIDIDLLEPKDTKIKGSDLDTVLGTNIVTTGGGADFDTYGVGPNDILRIVTGGLIVADYTIVQVLSPLFTHLQVDRPLPATVNGAQYYIFTPNAAGGLLLPLVRIDTIDLLDTSGQPVGATIPYAKPVDVRTNGFANSAHGIKSDVTDATLGIVSLPFAGEAANVAGLTFILYWDHIADISTTFVGVNPLALTDLVLQLNASVAAATGGAISEVAVVLDNGTRLGIIPVSTNTTVRAVSTAALPLFGFNDKDITSRDINSLEVFQLGGWASLKPRLDATFDVAQVLDGLQVGFYGGLTVPNYPFNGAQYDPLQTSEDFNPEVRRHLQVGARSLGTARVYFLDPTSFEVDAASLFTVTQSDGSVLNYFPDPTNSYQRIPSLPSGAKPLDGNTGGAIPPFTFESLSTDFLAKGIQKGDQLVIDYVPLDGTVVLTDPIAGLNVKNITLSIGGGIDKTIIFIHDNAGIAATDVTRQGAVDQINKAVGQVICQLTAGNLLEFNPDASVIVRGSSAGTSANALLGFSTVNGVDQNNDSPNKGTYTVFQTAPGGNVNRLVIDAPDFPTAASSQQFKVFRASLQRISSTVMATQVGIASLYYFDVELLSQGTGDAYNVVANVPMTVVGYRSDGYFLSTDDPNLSFSPVERPQLHISKSMLEIGVSDDPDNATQLAGQNIQLNYERSSLTDSVNNYILSDTERVINESPLARHLTPYFVRFDASYVGGSGTDVVEPLVENFILALAPDVPFNVSDLEQIFLNNNARSVDNPITLVAVVHNPDRSISIESSQNQLNTGRLAAFVPDVLNIARRIS